MKIRIFWSAMSVCMIVTAGAHTLQAPAKSRVQSQSDLPRFSYRIDGTASAMVDADDATFDRFAARVRADLDQVLAGYDIEDKSTLRELLQEKQALQELAGDFRGALETVDAVRALEEKPSARLTSGLFARARLQAAIDTGAESGAAYQQAFANHYREAIEPLPWEVVQDSIKSSYAGSRVTTRAALIGRIKTDVDPAATQSGGSVRCAAICCTPTSRRTTSASRISGPSAR